MNTIKHLSIKEMLQNHQVRTNLMVKVNHQVTMNLSNILMENMMYQWTQVNFHQFLKIKISMNHNNKCHRQWQSQILIRSGNLIHYMLNQLALKKPLKNVDVDLTNKKPYKLDEFIQWFPSLSQQKSIETKGSEDHRKKICKLTPTSWPLMTP